ncbi:MAG: hypothetical protein JW818_08930 [Pirellulales bacterium]|nr:hypothetical protein [Pirellulales bacterium]
MIPGTLVPIGCLVACLLVSLRGVKACRDWIDPVGGGRAPWRPTILFAFPRAGGMNVSPVLEPSLGPPGRGAASLLSLSWRSPGGTTVGRAATERSTWWRGLVPARTSLAAVFRAGPSQG